MKRESEIPLEDLLDDLPPEYLESLGKAESFSSVADEVSSSLMMVVEDIRRCSVHSSYSIAFWNSQTVKGIHPPCNVKDYMGYTMLNTFFRSTKC